MQKSVQVPNISCGHCVITIRRELEELEGVRIATADLTSKSVTVEWEAPASWEQIEGTLREIGYPPSS